LSALEVADRCTKFAGKFGTSRPRDMIQYEIDLFGYLVKVLAP
jgi:hypothetical protein